MQPKELKKMIDSKESFTLLDVREEEEFEIANIGGKLIPLDQLPTRMRELNHDLPIVVICHHGIRSAKAQSYLKNQEFTNVFNLEGGIDRWSVEIDTNLPRY